MREFSIVYTKIWHDAKFRTLSCEEKQLFLYILSCPHGNMIGCFTLPIEYIAYDIGWSSDDVRKNLSSLIDKSFVNYDHHHNTIFILNYLKHNKLSGEKVIKGAKNLYELLPKDSFLTKQVAEMMNFHLEIGLPIPIFESKIPHGYPIDTLSIPYSEEKTYPIDTPSIGYSQEIEIEMDIEMEKEIERENTYTSTSAAPKSTALPLDVVSEIFEYWKEKTQHKASRLNEERKKQIRRAHKSGYTKQNMLDAIDGCCNTPFNMGENDTMQKWDDLELILRPKKIERFIANKNQFMYAGNKGVDKTIRNLMTAGFTSAEQFLPD